MSDAHDKRLLLQKSSFAMAGGQFSQAAEYLTKYVRACSAAQKDKWYLSAQQSLGVCLKKQGKLHEAIGAYSEVLEVARQLQRTDGEMCKLARQEEASALSNIAVALKQQGLRLFKQGQVPESLRKYGAASEYCDQALEIDMELGDDGAVMSDLVNLGNLCFRGLDMAKAVGAFEESLKYSRKTGDSRLIGSALCGIGNVHRALGQYDNAVVKYREALRELRSSSGYDVQWLIDLTEANLKEVEELRKEG